MQIENFPIYIFAIAIFFPLPVNILLMSMSLFFAFIRQGLNKEDLLLYLFLLAGLFVSLLQQNYLGFYGMLAVSVVALNFSLFTHLHFQRENIYRILLIGSLFCAIVGLFQYQNIIEENMLSFFPLQVLDEPWNRITSTFFNANYYATVLELMIILSFDCLIHGKLIKLAAISLPIHFFMLYLSGCRSAWIALAIALPFLFYINRKYRLLKLTLLIELSTIFMIFLFPQLFPRVIDSNSNLATRISMWKTSLRLIVQHPLSFKGPMSYLKWCEKIDLVKTQHAHQLFIDAFLNFGFLIFLTFPFFKKLWKHILKNQRLKFVLPFLLVAFLHSLSDATFFWIQTSALLFLLIY